MLWRFALRIFKIWGFFLIWGFGGDHITSLIISALGGWISALNAFKTENSNILIDDATFDLFPERDTFEMMVLTKDFQWILELLNLVWFLLNQIAEKIFTRQAVITTLHWWLHPSHKCQITSIEVNWKVLFKILANQDQILNAKEHSNNKWKEDSELLR